MNITDSFYRFLNITPFPHNKALYKLHPFSIRTPEEIGEVFDAGSVKSTPKISDIITTKIDIWVFAQVAFIGAVTFVALCFLSYYYQNILLLPALIVVGAFAIPMSCLIFFWEINTPKNINLFTVLFMILVGGVFGIGSSLFLFDYTQLNTSWLHASSAGIIEETAKLAAVVVLMGRKRKFPWILNGLLLGASVGTGFAALESAGYAFANLWQNESLYSTILITVKRGVFSPFNHIIWTAASSAALWKAMNGREFNVAMIANAKFLKVFFVIMALHMLWNSPISFYPLMEGFLDAKMVLIAWLGWAIVLGLAKEGYAEIKTAQQRLPKVSACAKLILQGANFRDIVELRKTRTSIGRDTRNDIVLAHPSMSRRHAQITRNGEDYVLADIGSISGTYVNGEKITSKKLRHRDKISVCGIDLLFENGAQAAPR